MKLLNALSVVAAALSLAGPALAAPPGNADRIQVGGNEPVFPESITATSDGTIYTSSIGLGVVFKAAPGARQASAWTQKPKNGPQNILGVLADGKSGTLWACYSDMSLFKGNAGETAVLRAIDLRSGKVRRSYKFPDKGFCNDIAIAADGTVYATDTHGGRIMRLSGGSNALDAWFKDRKLKGADGIAVMQDGSLLVTNVLTDRLYELKVDKDGNPGGLTTLDLLGTVKGPDAIRPGTGGTFYLAENKAGKVDKVTLTGSKVQLKTAASGYQGPTSMTLQDGKLYILECKVHQYMEAGSHSPFFIYPVTQPGK